MRNGPQIRDVIRKHLFPGPCNSHDGSRARTDTESTIRDERSKSQVHPATVTTEPSARPFFEVTSKKRSGPPNSAVETYCGAKASDRFLALGVAFRFIFGLRQSLPSSHRHEVLVGAKASLLRCSRASPAVELLPVPDQPRQFDCLVLTCDSRRGGVWFIHKITGCRHRPDEIGSYDGCWRRDGGDPPVRPEDYVRGGLSNRRSGVEASTPISQYEHEDLGSVRGKKQFSPSGRLVIPSHKNFGGAMDHLNVSDDRTVAKLARTIKG